MRIALVFPGFSQSASDWAIPAMQLFACRLAQRHDVHVFSLRYPAAGTYTFCGLTHYAVGGGTQSGAASLSVWRRAIQAVVRHHRRSPFDLLHAFWLDEPGLAAVIAGTLLRRPVVASAAGGEMVYFPELQYGTWGSPLRRFIVRFVLRRATLVTAGSAYLRDLCLARGAPAGRTRLAPLGVDVQHLRPGEAPAWAYPTVVQAASLVPVKDQELLLTVLARIREKLPAVRLLLAGDGPLQPALRERARQLGISGLVRWAGRMPFPAMPAVYRQAHLYLQTSRHESQGMSVLEAMACGLPALGTSVGVLPEVAARPAGNGATQLAEQVVDLLVDRDAYRRARREARETAVERYSLNGAVERFEAVYRTLASDTPASGA